MGRDWSFYWGGGGGRSSSSTKKGRQSRKQIETKRHEEEEEYGGGGCMCAVFQIFDFPHNLQFALNHHHRSLNPAVSSLVQDDHFEPTIGLEAPRNSLDMEELKPATSKLAMVSRLKQEKKQEEAKNLSNVSVGINQIRTSCDSRPSITCRARADDFSSECSSSPGGAKTPNLVARLMGLDLLPENSTATSSPTFSCSSRKSGLKHPPPDPPDRARYLLDRGGSSSFNVLDNADISAASGRGGTLSLPETPRISLARKSDVDHYHHHHNHRLSLQINKENIIMGRSHEEFDCHQLSLAKRVVRNRRREQCREPSSALRRPVVDENNNVRSPSHYARQIVKQVKESVSRKVGADITNTIRNNNNKDHQEGDRRRLDDTQVVLLKPNKPSVTLGDDFSPTKHQSCSPRFRFLEPKTVKLPSSTTTESRSPPVQKSQKVISSNHTKPESQENHCPPPPPSQLENSSTTTSRPPKKQPPPQVCSVDVIRSKKEEPFVRPNHENKKCKRATTPLSSELLNPNNVPTILPALKKDRSSPPTKLPQKQVQDDDGALSSKRSKQLSSFLSQSYKQQLLSTTTTTPTTATHGGGATPPAGNDAEFQYIQRVLKRTGIEKDTSVSLAKWYSSSHPLDPSIFHYIELFPHQIATKNSNLRLRCNRKLIFQLVDELLVQIVKPRARPCQMNGSELLEKLCTMIQNLPTADCQVLEDIDALIDNDLQGRCLDEDDDGEEEDGIVVEIEHEIVESLVHETAVVVLGVARPYGGGGGRRCLTSGEESHG